MACDCIEKEDEVLSLLNAQVKKVQTMGLNDDLSSAKTRVALDVQKWNTDLPYDTQSHRKPWIMAHFCPFCGTRYIPVDAPGDTATNHETKES